VIKLTEAYLIRSMSGLYVNGGVEKVFLDEDIADLYVSQYNDLLEIKWKSQGYKKFPLEWYPARKTTMRISDKL